MSSREPSFADRLAPVLIIIVVALAFITGSLWQKVNSIGTTSLPAANNVDQAAGADDQGAYSQLSGDEAQKFVQTASVKDTDHLRGSKDAPVTLIEYSDLQCPFCSMFHTTVQQLVDEYGDKVSWVYRHFPLDSIHPQARPAALGAECVSSLAGADAFWSFTDKVFANQDTALADLPGTAASVGVDKGAYQTCVSNASFANVVDADYQSGLDVGVSGTPGNFILNKDGEVWAVHGAVPYETLKEVVELALN